MIRQGACVRHCVGRTRLRDPLQSRSPRGARVRVCYSFYMAAIPESVRYQLKDRWDTVLSGAGHLTLYIRPGSSRLAPLQVTVEPLQHGPHVAHAVPRPALDDHGVRLVVEHDHVHLAAELARRVVKVTVPSRRRERSRPSAWLMTIRVNQVDRRASPRNSGRCR